MTQGPIGKNLIRFVLPLIGISIFQQLYNTADFLFVSNVLGTTAAAAVGASSTIITCMIGLFTGIAVGAEVTIARAIGAGDERRASAALHTAVVFGALGGLAFMLAGILLAPDILALLDTPEGVMPQAVVYIRVYFLSIPASILYNMCASAMRACGNSSTPFSILAVFGVVNVVGDALFLVVIPMGVAGAALATILCQWLSLAVILRCLCGNNQKISFSWRALHCDWALLGLILRIGLPAGIQSIVITFSNIIVQYYINGYGELAIAAFATYYKVENFIYLPVMAFGQAATTFSGQNAGVRNYPRIWRGTALAAALGIAVTLCVTGVILFFSPGIFGWFMRDTAVREIAIQLAFIAFPFYWLYPVLEVLGGSLRGMGYALASMLVILLNLCGLRIALLAIFSQTFHTVNALASVYPITWAVAAACFVALILAVRKRTSKVS